MASRVISAILTLQDRNFSSNLERAAQRSDDLGRGVTRVGNRIQRFSDNARDQFRNVATAAANVSFGALITGATILSTSVTGAVLEMESAFSRLEARTGETGHAIEEYKAIAKDVFVSGFGESITQASDSVATFAAMFRDIEYTELNDLTKGAYTIAETWDTEAKEVGRSVQAMVNNFEGLSSSQALDLITVAFQRTGDLSDDLLDTFSEYSMHFSKLGLSAQEFAGIMVRAGENGVFSLDFAADAVKELGIRVIDESKTTAEGFAAIGFNAEEMANKFSQGGEVANSAFQATVAGLAAMDDPIERNAAGVALWGTKWEDVREEVILAMGDSASAVAGFEGATNRAAESLKSSFGSRVSQVWRELQIGLSDIAESQGAKELLDSIATTAENMVPKVESLALKAIDFANSVQDNWPQIKDVLISVGAGVGTLVVGFGALKVISGITALIQGYRAAMAAATIGQWALNTAMLASPWTWVVIAIAAVVAIGVALYQNWDTVKAKAGELWDKTKEVFAGIYDWGMKKIQPVTDFFSKLKDTFNNFKTAISNFKLPKWVTSIGSTISNASSKVKGWFSGKPDGSHASGLNYVPFDGYIAELHKGEMVIPAREAEKLRQSESNKSFSNSTVSNPSTVSNSKSENKFEININAQGMTTDDIINDLVPKLKLRLANI